MLQQTYDDEPVTSFYMAKVSQQIVVILRMLPLFIEGKLGKRRHVFLINVHYCY